MITGAILWGLYNFLLLEYLYELKELDRAIYESGKEQDFFVKDEG